METSSFNRQPMLSRRRGCVCRAMDFMLLNMGRHLTLTEIASAAGMSMHHFSRTFRNEVGRSPLATLLEYRMNKAKLLLKSENYPISEVAHQCGFSSHSAFSTVFKRTEGCSPTAYRLEHEKKLYL